MTIPAARPMRYVSLLALGSLFCMLTQPLKAQDERERTQLDRRIEQMFGTSLDDIIWSDISVYQLRDDYLQRLVASLDAENDADKAALEEIGQRVSATGPLPAFADAMIQIVQMPQTRVGGIDVIKRLVATKYGIDPEDLDETDLTNGAGIARSIVQRRLSRPKEFYLVTSRVSRDESAGATAPPRIIALVGIARDELTNKQSIKVVKGGTNVYTYLSSNRTDTGMYSELKQGVAEGNPSLPNVTFSMRDLSQITLAPATKAQAHYLDENKYPWVLVGISEGRPPRGEPKETDSTGEEEDAGGGLFSGGGGGLFGEPAGNNGDKLANSRVPGTGEYPYEISVGNDVLFSFRSYKKNSEGKTIPDPKWGIELKNNFDEINYPSIWGGRMTLSAILEDVKLGAVLPQPVRFGDSTIASSGIGSYQQKIIGGYGLVFSGDFAAPIIDNSGLFSLYATYTFSEAETDKMGITTVRTVAGQKEVVTPGETAYLVRWALQTYYSFGFYLDADARYLFRLKLGATAYGVDDFNREQDVNPIGEQDAPTFAKVFSQTKAGVAGKLEFMKSGINTPYGLGVQYFDQSILSNIWIQFFPTQRWDIKLEGKYFAPILRDPYAWENESLVVPSLSVKYHFD